MPEIQNLLEKAQTVILDKERELRLVFACLLAEGHLLLEDLPGRGKTTLVKTVAKLLGLPTARVQFTNDLLPADILGGSIYDPKKQEFQLHRGPIFNSMIFADELNRATPRTQSAFLQAMEEKTVSLDGETHTLPKPFFVMATQNPEEYVGTYALPESQLDRFLMRIELGEPSREAEKKLLLSESRQSLIDSMASEWSESDVLAAQEKVRSVKTSESLVEYVQDIADYTRQTFDRGVSPRGLLDLLKAAKAWAWIDGRDFVLPEDVQAVAESVLGHRISEGSISDVLQKVAVRA